MKLGYARVSTDEQSVSVQREELKAAGCDLIFAEAGSGKTSSGRPVLLKLLASLDHPESQHPVIVVTKLDRLARSTSICSTSSNGSARPGRRSFPCRSPGPTQPHPPES